MVSPVKIWRNQKFVAGMLGKAGTIVSWTMIRVPPAHFASFAPYPVVLVDLDGATRLSCQLVDWEEAHLRFGQKVTLVVRRIREPNTEGIIPYGIKAKPIE